MSDSAAPTGSTAVKEVQLPAKTTPRKQPPYNVILLDDDDHTYEYVIQMLGKLFGYSEERAFQMADEVNATGRVIVATTTLERAELKRDQIHAYGADPLSKNSKGSMRATIEPTE